MHAKMRSRAEYAIVPYVPPHSAPYSAPHAAPPPVGMADLPDDVVLKMLQYLIDFEPAATFAGARLGFVFKTGRRGLGYYVDAPERAVGTDYIRLSATCSGLRTVVLSSLVEPALSSARDMQDRAEHLLKARAGAPPLEDQNRRGPSCDVVFALWTRRVTRFSG